MMPWDDVELSSSSSSEWSERFGLSRLILLVFLEVRLPAIKYLFIIWNESSLFYLEGICQDVRGGGGGKW